MFVPFKKQILRGMAAYHEAKAPKYHADGIITVRKNLGFMDGLRPAWDAVTKANKDLPGGLPDIRWRTHICTWAARNGLKLDGDFVECGVFTGIYATAICSSMSLGSKRFWLFDTYEGIPERGTEEEQRSAHGWNAGYYSRLDGETIVRAAVGNVEGVRIVKGLLPETLAQADIERIAYLSMDLNNAPAEMACAEALWDRLVPGAIVVLDDYAFEGHETQHQAWDQFAARHGFAIATLPTGQGLIVR